MYIYIFIYTSDVLYKSRYLVENVNIAMIYINEIFHFRKNSIFDYLL